MGSVTNVEIMTDPDFYLADLFLDKSKIYFGDQLKEGLVKTFGKTNDASRKIIERAVQKGIFASSSPVSFGKGTFAYYSPEKKIGFEDLLGATIVRRPTLYRLLAAIKRLNGVLAYYEALKITSSQIIQSKSKTQVLDSLIGELEFFDLVIIKTDKNNIKYIVKKGLSTKEEIFLMARQYTLMVIDSIFLFDILNSLKRLNLIDNEFVRYRNRKAPSYGAPHNNFVWDAFAYTKTTGINTVYSKKHGVAEKQTLVLLDVVISRNYETFDFYGFYDRIQVLINSTRKERKVLPIMVYQTISDEALAKARSLGYLTYSMPSFFGNGIAEIISNLTTIKLNEQSDSDLSIDAVKLIDDSLNKIAETGNGYNLQNLKGDFFQSLMYQLLRHIYSNCIIKQAVKLQAIDAPDGVKKDYEYDFVIFTHKDELIVFEVKGYDGHSVLEMGDYNTKNTLKWFFCRTFPSIQKHYMSASDRDWKIKACFITTARFEPKGESFLRKLNEGKLKPDGLEIAYNGKKLMDLISHQSLDHLKATVEKYFLKN